MKSTVAKIKNRSPDDEIVLTPNGIKMIQFLQSHDKV